YRALNKGPLAFDEPFPYHPHITLAQGLPPGRAQSLYELARKRWAEAPYSRRLRAERACFVQSTVTCTWVDLVEIRLAGVPVGETRWSRKRSRSPYSCANRATPAQTARSALWGLPSAADA